MQAERPALTCSPSLNSYAEFPHDRQIHPSRERTMCDSCSGTNRQLLTRDGEEEAENENDFSFDCLKAVASPISADQIFHNGIIKPTLPLPIHAPPKLETSVETMKKTTSRRMALRKLFTENEDESTDSAASELDSLPSDTYCVWKPITSPSSVTPNEIGSDSSERWKPKTTSSSVTPNQIGSGSSKGWKLKDLLTKSPIEKDNNPSQQVRAEPQLVRKEGERRKSYLPYRPELIGGIFGNSGSRRNLQR